MTDQNFQNEQVVVTTQSEVKSSQNYKPYFYTAIVAIISVAGLGYYMMPTQPSYDVRGISDVATTTQSSNIGSSINTSGASSTSNSNTEPVACTMDAMMCPDGSYVGRSGPNCQFVCPIPTEQNKGIVINFKADQASDTAYKLPITINGYVSDTYKWRVFEGEAGVVQVYAIINGQEKQIAAEPITLKNFNEGASSPFYFDMMVGDRQWMSNISDKDGYILIKEAGAKDGDVIDSIKIPIIFDIPSN